jgi:hypothetical protein
MIYNAMSLNLDAMNLVNLVILCDGTDLDFRPISPIRPNKG